jgi:hypothetical protein
MSMCHKAYAFDWDRFEAEFHDLLECALATNDLKAIIAFIDENRDQCRDPYEGNPLPADWRGLLETDGIQELADFALTKYYDPSDDWGIHERWMDMDNDLPEDARAALLGLAIGPPERRFDPGAMGAYFQTSSMVRSSASALAHHDRGELRNYLSLLRRSEETGGGIYVTF